MKQDPRRRCGCSPLFYYVKTIFFLSSEVPIFLVEKLQKGVLRACGHFNFNNFPMVRLQGEVTHLFNPSILLTTA